VASDLTLAFVDLPLLIAKAMRQNQNSPEPSSRELWDLKYALVTDVQHGRLVVCHPKTLAAYLPPVPENELNKSVLIPEPGLVEYLAVTRGIEVHLKRHGLGPDFWTFENAAADVQKTREWTDGTKTTFLSYLLEDARTGDTSVFDPDTLKAFDPAVRTIRPSIDLVGTEDVWDCYVLGGDMWRRSYDDNDNDDEVQRWPGTRISDVDRPPSLRDKKPWTEEDIEALPGLYLYQQAAWEIAEQQRWHDATFQDFLLDMAEAIRGNHLTIYKPKTGVPVSPETQSKWFVSVNGVNEWLEKSSSITYRWDRPAPHPSTLAESHSDPVKKTNKRSKKRTWRDVAMPYIVQTLRSGQYSTAKELYNELMRTSGSVDSPFEKGIGPHRHELFVREISQSIALSTFEKARGEIWCLK
jgi:hypothetical protein